MAREVIDALRVRGRVPVLCGGTGLYLRAALDDFRLDEGLAKNGEKGEDSGLGEPSGSSRPAASVESSTPSDPAPPSTPSDPAESSRPAPPAAPVEPSGPAESVEPSRPAPPAAPSTPSDPAESRRPGASSTLRQRLTAQAEELGAEAFHGLLSSKDPQSAALIHPHNVRRVVRAFEFLEQGSSYARQHEGFAEFRALYPVRFVGISVEPEVLYQVIEQRVDGMLAAGLLDEVRSLLAAGFGEGITARQAIGYKELVPVLAGECCLADAVAQIKQSTRRYAKRQRSWFKRDGRIRWLDATDLHARALQGGLSGEDLTRLLLNRALHLLECTE
jgi:tRNA A37 N6-isopentenylltransferase MiaA